MVIDEKIKITIPIKVAPDRIAESIAHGIEAGGRPWRR